MLSYFEINAANLIHNIKMLQSLLNLKTKTVAVIKANAYGHGQNEVAQILEKHVDFFQVDDAEEFKLLRTITKKPTLVFGYVAQADLQEVIELNGILCVFSERQLKDIDAIGTTLKRKVPVHISIDALLGREGILPTDIPQICEALKTLKHIELQGVYAHFANIEDTSDFTHAQKQIDAFLSAVELFTTHGFPNLMTHMSATSGVFAYEQFNQLPHALARIGIGLYGYWPSPELEEQYSATHGLKPALRWISHIAQIKDLPEGHPIGYGLTYITDKPTRIAVIPQGYSDGYDRGLSNAGAVLIRGQRCPILGRVMMNMCIADVTDLSEVAVEDGVVLLGSQEDQYITAEEIAEKTGTINYEVIARLNPLLPRKIV